ncbi:beta-1,6-N-acetylglucosaminyltransferase [Geodermatophilus sp. SYSU D01036]
MSDLAVVVLAHTDAAHVGRLVRALDGLPVFLHCDVKTGPGPYEQMGRLAGRVTMLPRLDTRISSWSLVRAELAGLEAAVRATTARHVALLSGADYPLLSVDGLLAALEPWRGHSYLYNRALPFAQWSGGGEWRFRYRFLVRNDNVVTVRGRPLRWPVRRRLPEGLELRASSQWKIYARHHVQLLLRVMEDRPDLMRFWRTTFVPDESFAASVLASPGIVGSDALQPCLANPWYYRFPRGGHHPRWLSREDFADLARARRARPLEPAGVRGLAPDRVPEHAKLFARKFRSEDPEVLDLIDTELRV